jgi:hypothetical protein
MCRSSRLVSALAKLMNFTKKQHVKEVGTVKEHSTPWAKQFVADVEASGQSDSGIGWKLGNQVFDAAWPEQVGACCGRPAKPWLRPLGGLMLKPGRVVPHRTSRTLTSKEILRNVRETLAQTIESSQRMSLGPAWELLFLFSVPPGAPTFPATKVWRNGRSSQVLASRRSLMLIRRGPWHRSV